MLAIMALSPTLAHSFALPADQADALYHSYDDGDLQTRGMAFAASKQFGTAWSVNGSAGNESIDNATPDILSIGTPYSDSRTEWSVGANLLTENMLLDVRYQSASEDDFDNGTMAVELSSSVFGDMTTLTLGFGRGRDELRRIDDADFHDYADHRYYRAGLSQALSQTWNFAATYSAALDSGYLGNPYRYARILGVWIPEQMPTTRSGHALTFATQHYLFDHAAVHGTYRYYWDTWAIRAHTLEASYRQDLAPRWAGEVRYRYYTQSEASFYSDNFTQEYNYYSRDKELSDMSSHSIGMSARLRFLPPSAERLIAYGDIELSYDYITFDYSNYTDVRSGIQYAPGAHVFHINLSVGY